jgi:hypothetical protein
MLDEHLNTSFLIGPVRSGMPATWALSVMDATEMPTAMPASPSQMAIHAHGMVCRDAMTDAAMAVRPMATCPHPDTAVKVAALSMIPRMNRRLSMARACISGGSEARRVFFGRSGVMDAMNGVA